MSIKEGKAIMYFNCSADVSDELEERLRRLGQALPFGRIVKTDVHQNHGRSQFTLELEGFVAVDAVLAEVKAFTGMLERRQAETSMNQH